MYHNVPHNISKPKILILFYVHLAGKIQLEKTALDRASKLLNQPR